MKQLWHHLLAVAIVGVWGMTFVSTKVLIDASLTPSQIFFMRFVLAYVGIWLISPKTLLCKSWRDEMLMALLGLTGGSIYFLAENTALEYTLTTSVSFLVCTTPLLTAIASVALMNTRIGDWLGVKVSVPLKRLFIGSFIALVGAALVIFNGHFVLQLNPAGDMLAISAALLWTLYSLILPKVLAGYSSAFVTRKIFFYGLVTIVPFILSEPWNITAGEFFRTPSIWANVVFLGLVASLACFALWNVVMRELGTVKGSNYIYLNPLFTLFGAVTILHEPFTPLAALGAAFILIGVIATNYDFGKKKKICG